MKTLFVAGMVGLLVAVTPTISLGQGATLSSTMPSAQPGHVVRYQYTFTKVGTGTLPYSGQVDVASNQATLYYREYRDDQVFREVLYNRDAGQVLLFNHPQNRLDVFSQLPHNSVSFIPFPFQDEAIARVVELAPARNLTLPGGNKVVSSVGTLSKSMQSVPVQFRAELTPTASGTRVKTFSIRASDGEVASWAFEYAGNSATPALPTTITRQMASPIMTPEDRAKYQRREVVPLTHWRPDARVIYTFVEDRLVGEGAVSSEESFLRLANEQTTVVDRRDVKQVARFRYRKEGGNLAEQIAAAHSQGDSSTGGTPGLLHWLSAGGYVLLAPFVLGALCLIGGGWVVLRRSSLPSKTPHQL